MLDAMRQAATGWASKVFLGLLALSFVAWGVTGRTPQYGGGELAEVGNVSVSGFEYSRELNQRLNALRLQLQRGLSMEQANMMGIPESVLQELIARAALRDQAQEYNLGVPDRLVLAAIQDDPAFHIEGKFDRDQFRGQLYRMQLTEAEFVEYVKTQMITRQIATAISGDISPPQLMTEALYKYQTETRTISHIVVDQSAIDPITDPDNETIAKYYEQNKDRYQAPEYRKIGYIALTPDSLSDVLTVSEDDIRASYESRKASEYTTPERRQFHQIRYSSKDEAEAAAKLLNEGRNFEDLLAARNLTLSDTDIGLKSRPEIIDPDIATAVFGAALNAIVPVIDASLGPAIIRVGEVEPETVTPLQDVADKIREKLAERGSREQISNLYDEIENERGTGATLEEVASSLGLNYHIVDAIARDGSVPKNAAAAEIPGQLQVVADAFLSDVGVENNPVRIGNNQNVFYEVLGVTETRPLTEAEARDDVVEDWKREETSAKVGERAKALHERMKAGASLDEIAVELGTVVQKSENVRRSAASSSLSRNAVAQAFAGQNGHIANADGIVPPARILLKVDQVTVPAFLAETEDAKQIASQLEDSLRIDFLQAYQTKLLASREPTVNQALFDQITGRIQTP